MGEKIGSNVSYEVKHAFKVSFGAPLLFRE